MLDIISDVRVIESCAGFSTLIVRVWFMTLGERPAFLKLILTSVVKSFETSSYCVNGEILHNRQYGN